MLILACIGLVTILLLIIFVIVRIVEFVTDTQGDITQLKRETDYLEQEIWKVRDMILEKDKE